MEFLLVFAVAVVCAALLWRSGALSSPSGLFALVSASMVLGLVILPLGFLPLGLQAALLWCVALVVMTSFHGVATALCKRGRPPRPTVVGWGGGAERRFALVGITLALIQLVGVLSYRSRISVATGADFSMLSAETVRSTEALLTTAGIGGLLFSVSPLLCVVGVMGGTWFRPQWLALTALGLLAAGNTPGRTPFLTALAAALLTWWYTRIDRASTRWSGVRTTLVICAVIAAGFAYFYLVGSELNKADVATIADTTWFPKQFHSIALYWLGGPIALSTALESGLNPVFGNQGRSFYIFIKLASLIDPSIVPPETAAAYVSIPAATNAYTGIGDVWFDGGAAGLFVLFAFCGVLSGWSFFRARSGDIRWLWIAAFLSALVLVLPIAAHFFELSVVLWALVGFGALWFVSGGRVPHRMTVAGHPRPQLASRNIGDTGAQRETR